MTSASNNVLRQPAALLKLCFVEMWERLGFVTLMALAALYFASPVATGGLGWSNADALLYVGYFAALLMTLPMLGGWVADNILGIKRAILVGGAMMAAGYLALGILPSVFLTTGLDGPTRAAIFEEAGLAFVRPEPQLAAWEHVSSAVAARVGDERADSIVTSLRLAYTVQSFVFVIAFILVACGNALFKPSVSAAVGALYSPGDLRRDGGFTLFWTFINAGSLLAYVVGGWVGETFGWNFGFLVAFLGMAAGLTYYLYVQRQLPEPPRTNRSFARVSRRELTLQERGRMRAIVIMISFAVVFHVCHGQIYGLIGLFVLQDVDRNIAGLEIPALWVTSLNPLVILALAPPTALLWDYLGRRGSNPSFASKFVMALVLLAIGQLVMLLAALDAQGPQRAALGWVVLAVIAMSVAEFPLQPIGLAMVTRLSPVNLVGLMIGAWLFGMAIAGAIGGNVGALASTYGLPPVFAGMAAACVAAAGGLMVLRRFLDRWMALSDTSAPQEIPATPQVRVG